MAKFRRFVKRFSGSSASLIQPDAMIYGALRKPISDATARFVPGMLGDLGDEAAMATICWLALKFGGRKGMVSNVARKGLVVENARAGEYLAQSGLGFLGGMTGSSTSSNAVTGYSY